MANTQTVNNLDGVENTVAVGKSVRLELATIGVHKESTLFTIVLIFAILTIL